MTAGTYFRVPVSVTVSTKVAGEDGLGLGAQERRPALCGPVGCRVGAGVVEDFPDGGGGDLDAQDE